MVGGYCVGFSSVTYLLSMLLVSVEKTGPIINGKFGGAVTVTAGSQVRDFTNLDSDELFEAAGAPGTYSVRELCVVSRLTAFF